VLFAGIVIQNLGSPCGTENHFEPCIVVDRMSAGHHLAQLPVDARVGKLLLLGCSLGCLSPVLTIAACLSYKSPFSSSSDQQEAAQRMKLSLAAPGHSLHRDDRAVGTI